MRRAPPNVALITGEGASPWEMASADPGGIRLDSVTCGDALELIPRLPDRSIDLVLWDPDYGVEVDFGEGHRDPAEAIEFVARALELLKPKSRTGTVVIFWSGSLERTMALEGSRAPSVWPFHYRGVWYKMNGAGPSGNGLARRHEMWYWLKAHDGPKPPSEWSRLPDVLAEPRIVPGHREAVNHPTQKPVRLLERLIRFFTLPGAVVLDPTVGSGSTCVAAIQTGRRYVGFELNPDYVAMAARRIERAQPTLGLLEQT